MRFVLCFFFVFLSPTFFIHTSFYDTYLFFYLCLLFYVPLCQPFLYMHPLMISIFLFTYAFYFLSSYALHFFYILLRYTSFFLLMPFISCPLMPTFFIYASFYDTHLFFTYAFYFLSSYVNLFLYMHPRMISIFFLLYALFYKFIFPFSRLPPFS